MEPTDHLIIAETSLRRVDLLVGSVTGAIERSKDDVVPADAIVPRTEYIKGVTKLDENLVLTHDLASRCSFYRFALHSPMITQVLGQGACWIPSLC